MTNVKTCSLCKHLYSCKLQRYIVALVTSFMLRPPIREPLRELVAEHCDGYLKVGN